MNSLEDHLFESISMYGDGCVVVMGDDQFVELVNETRNSRIYYDDSMPAGEVGFMGAKIRSNGIPGTRGFVVFSDRAVQHYWQLMAPIGVHDSRNSGRYTVILEYIGEGRDEGSNTSIHHIYAPDPRTAETMAIDGLSIAAGLVCEEEGPDRDEELDALRQDYRVVAVYDGHFANLSGQPAIPF